MRKIIFLCFAVLINHVLFAQTFNDAPNAAITDDGQHCYNINVTGVGVIDAAFGLESVCVDITHTYDGDLDIFLIAPDGTSVELTTDNGGAGDNFDNTCFDMGAATNITGGTAPFNGSYIPEGDLGNINNGQNANGIWQLCIEDDAGGDDGTFNDWSITFGNNSAGPAPPITINACTGVFTDLGGAFGDYGENETQIWTICPDAVGYLTTLDFTMWDVQGQFVGDDELIIYDGDDITAPVLTSGNELNPISGIIQASSSNISGCLTIQWTSNADGITGAGWEADISCSLPCQQVQTVWAGSTPSDVAGYIDICQGESVSFSATGLYPQNGNAYTQIDATSTFEWDFGDGTNATGMNVNHTFNTEGGYDINLTIIDNNSCQSINDLGIRVRVSTTPTFAGTVAATDPVCLGNCSQLTGVVNMTPWETPPGQILAGTTFLPDGVGESYSSSLSFDNFATGATVTNVSDIVEICANIEHSFVGDLDIIIQCPNGDTTHLVFFDGTFEGDFLGEPVESTPEGPGVGYDYCWSPIGVNTFPDMLNINSYSYTDVNGTAVGPVDYIPAGTYAPVGDWNNLVGCPLNGIWSIIVTDNLVSDDGYIFEWGISFDPNLYPNGWGFTPSVTTESWSGTTVTAGNPTSACPPDLGPEDYTYTIVDNFGCIYDTTISINAIGLAIDSSSTNPTCDGSCDGTISIFNVTGNVGALSYAWAGGNAAGQTTATVTGLCAGTYSVTVTDGGASCTNVQTFVLVDPPALIIDLTQTPDNCGAGDGTITVDITNGLAPIDYQWTGQESGIELGETDPYTITNLEAGNYSITASDANTPACLVDGTISVGTTGAVASGFTTSPNQCLEGNSFDFTNTGDSGGSVSITYTVTAPSGGSVNLAGPDVVGFVANEAGVWTVTQTTVDGACSDNSALNFTVYNEPQLSLSSTDVSCNQLNTGSGTNDGSITASVTNSNGGEVYSFLSGTGSFVANQATSLSAGTYSILVVDNQGCNDTLSIIINEPDQIILNLTSTSNTCNGDTLGSASVASIVGGVGPFTFLWSTTDTSQNINNLSAGTYTVTVFDSDVLGNTCFEEGSQVITEPSPETYSSSSVDATCGLATGSATVSVTTVVPSTTYAYNWYDNVALTGGAIATTAASASTSNTINNVSAGTYYVEVENANGCTDVVAVVVADNGSPTITVDSSSDISCNGGSDGQITVSLGGTLNPNFTYVWEYNATPYTTVNSGATSDQQINLPAGIYDIEVTDNAGCQVSASVELFEPTPLSGSISVVDANCSLDGSLTVNVTGGTSITGTYSYQWSNDGVVDLPPSDPQTISEGAGVYYVTVYDDNDCELALTETVNDIGGIDADTTIISHVLCFGSNEGQVTANPIGGNGVYNFYWTPDIYTNPTSATYENLPADTYTCVVTDGNGCSAVTSVVINEPSKIEIDNIDTTMVSCFNGSDGTITVSVTGGSGGYTYQWDMTTGSQTTALAENLSEGCYRVTVEDINNCQDDTIVCIHEPLPLSITVDTYEAHCNQSDGSAVVNISGGTEPYSTINWSSGTATALSDSIVGLAFGTYSVEVFDSKGCSENIAFDIDSAARGNIVIATYDSISCFGGDDGMVQVSIGGGGQNNSYVWSPTGFTITNNGATYSDLDPGLYSVVATDAWGCELSISHEIFEPVQLEVNINVQNDRCAGSSEGEAEATVIGGTAPYTYQWDDDSLSITPVITGLSAGIYPLTVTDFKGCNILDTAVITEPEAMSLTALIDSSSCDSTTGNIFTFPTGGTNPYSFEWSPDPLNTNADSLMSISQGNYCLTITDSKNCKLDSCFVVVDQNSPTVQIDSIHNPSCFGDNLGEAFASAYGGVGSYTWNWSSDSLDLSSISSNVATNLDGGTVYVTVTDENGCQATDNAVLTENSGLFVSVFTNDVECFGDSTGSAEAVVLGGTGVGTYSYTWTGVAYNGASPFEAIDTNLSSGMYSLLVEDANGCQALINNIEIFEPQQLGFTVSSTPTSCFDVNDGTATIYPTGGTGSYYYLWDDNPNGQTSQTASGLAANWYNPIITDDYGCELIASVQVTQPDPLVLDSIVYNHITCYGVGDAFVSTYVSGGVGSYNYTYINPTGDSSFTQTISNLGVAGTYFIHIEDGNACDFDTTHIVNQPPAVNAYTENGDLIHESCYDYCDGSILLTIGGGTGDLVVTWNDYAIDTTYRENLCPGDYLYTVEDENGCSISGSLEIIGNPELSVFLIDSQDATCNQCDGSASVNVIGGVGPFEYSWSGGNFSVCGIEPYPNGQNIYFQNQLPQGIHTVTVEDGNECTASLDINISNLTGPSIDDIDITNVLCHGDATGNTSITISGGTGQLSYSWEDPGATGSVLIANSTIQSNLYAGTYYFTVQDANLCADNAVIVVDENDPLILNIVNIIDATCDGDLNGSATMQAFGGVDTLPYTYNWSSVPQQNTMTAIGLGSGQYNAELIDANGCSVSEVFEISEPEPITLSSFDIQNTSCAFPQLCDGSINVFPQGGNSAVYYYDWFGYGQNQNDAANLCAGTYQLQINDIEGCFANFTFNVTQPDTIQVYLGQDPIACNDPNGMVWIDSITGGSVMAYYNNFNDHMDPNYPLGPGQWETTWGVNASHAAYVDGVYNQYYEVQVFDPNNQQCSIVQGITVGEVPEPYLFSQQAFQASCHGAGDGEVLIQVKQGTPEFSYTWSAGSNISFPSGSDTVRITNIPSGTHYLTVTDDNGCQVLTSFYIVEPNSISVSASMQPEGPVCLSQMAIIYANGTGGTPPYKYNWLSNDTSWTNQTSIYTYPTQDTVVSVFIKDKNNCIANTNKFIVVYDSLKMQVIDDGFICKGESFTLDVIGQTGGNGNYNYLWSNGSDEETQEVFPTSDKTYYVTFSDNCDSPVVIDSLDVKVHPIPEVYNVTRADSCAPLGVNFIPDPADADNNYLWNFGDLSSEEFNESNNMVASHYFENSGTYDISLSVISPFGCEFDTIFENWVTVYALPEANYATENNPASLFDNVVKFIDITDSEDEIDKIIWSFGNGETAVGPVVETTYDAPKVDTGYIVQMYVETVKGCVDSVQFRVRVNDEFTLYIPDAFTPGKDGNNDYFYPIGHGADKQLEYQMIIYDRWGHEVYNSNIIPFGIERKSNSIIREFEALGIPEKERGWNGRYQNTGSFVPNGTYSWLLRLHDVNKVPHERSGRVTVIR
jgi:subtilisin-like proprotein convertase family protein